MQKARRRPFQGSDRLWTHGFRFSFTPLPGVLFTFPSRYSFAIGLSVVFSLAGWCRQIHTGFLRSRATQDARRPRPHSGYGALTPFGPPSQDGSPMRPSALMRVLQPRRRLDAGGLGPSPFAHHYLGNHCCFLLLRVLRCFSSPGSPPFRDSPCGLGCPIRTSADRRPSAPPRGFSQLITSFIASESQGIPRTPFVTSYLCSSRSYFLLLYSCFILSIMS